MSSVQVYEAFFRALERYGFGIVLATAILWFVRLDLVLPIVEAHRSFLQEMARSQKEISAALQEQTKLLYAIQPRTTQNTDVKTGVN